ncbi:helix-turn-helix domain-containing protein [Paenibacillus sp. IITD108]|uniref:helix-turn-helix domain-containing protein n=1 Tax=Paenibacillus sp. IITD108 TaxID=3116649 RepID=UPI002F42D2BB
MLFVLLMSIIPVVLLGMFSAYFASNMIQREVDHNHQIILSQIKYQFDSIIRSLEKNSVQLANNTTIGETVKTTPDQNITPFLTAIDSIQWQRGLSEVPFDISLISKHSGKVYSTIYGYINESQFKYNSMLNNTNISYNSSIVIPPNSSQGQHELLLLRPVPAFYSDEPDGILVLHVSLEHLTKLFEHVQLGGNRQLLVVDNEGKIVMSQNQDEIGTRLTVSSEWYGIWANPEGDLKNITKQGVSYRPSIQKSTFNNWTYIAMTPDKDLTRQAQSIQGLTWVVVLSLIVVWGIIALFGSNRLYIPIQRLLYKFTGEFKADHNHRDGIAVLDTFIQLMVKTNEKLKYELSEQLPYLKETVFQQMIRGEMSEQEIHRKTEQYGFPLKGRVFYVCVADLERFVIFQEEYKEKDRSLMMHALRRMMEELCEESFSCATAIPLPGQVAMIIGIEKPGGATERECERIAGQVLVKAMELFQLSVTVSLSSVYIGYDKISDAYQEANELLSYRLLLGSGDVILRRTIDPVTRQSGQSLVKWQKKIVQSLAIGNLEEAKEHLVQMLRLVPKYAHNSETVLGLFAYLLGEIDHLLLEWGQNEADSQEISWYKELYQMNSLQEVRHWCEMTVFPKVIKALEEANFPKQSKIVQQAIYYIHEEFTKDLSLQQLADRFGVTPSQMSRFFKEETSFTFGDYLIKVRMEQAQKWLIYTDMPIKEIADRLRYTSVTNFNRIFKQFSNEPPGQYRKKNRENS